MLIINSKQIVAVSITCLMLRCHIPPRSKAIMTRSAQVEAGTAICAKLLTSANCQLIATVIVLTYLEDNERT